MSRASRRRQIKRRKQVRRQMTIMGGLLLLLIITIVSCSMQQFNKRKTETFAATQAGSAKKGGKAGESSEKAESEEQRYKRVRKQAEQNGYPPNIIEMLDKNRETLQFVEDYGIKKDRQPADDIGSNFVEGQIPLLMQYDERWGYSPYGSSVIAVSGCGPTCLSMVVAGLTKNPTVTPAKMADYGTQNQYVDQDNNTLWRFMQEAPANWNITVREVILDENRVKEELEAGRPIICSVTPGDFTTDGHFIVLTGYQDGKVTVNDPNSQKNSGKTWVFADIADQIAAMWSYAM